MSSPTPLERFRRPTTRTGVAVALVALLLLAEALAVGHPYDSRSHSNDQLCAVCLAAATFHSGNAATPLPLDFAAAAPVAAAVILAVFFSVAPTRRYARGPPAASFAL